MMTLLRSGFRFIPVAVLFVCLALVHILWRKVTGYRGGNDGMFFFIGRYLDPAVLLLALGGVVALFALGELTKWQRNVLRIGVPILGLYIIGILSPTRFQPSVYSGLTVFSSKPETYLTTFAVLLAPGRLRIGHPPAPADRLREARGLAHRIVINP